MSRKNGGERWRNEGERMLIVGDDEHEGFDGGVGFRFLFMLFNEQQRPETKGSSEQSLVQIIPFEFFLV